MDYILFQRDKHYHDIEDLRHYNPYKKKESLTIDLKKLKNDPIRSKLDTSLYITILEKYEPILEMLIHHFQFVLKSQLLELLGYDNIEKSRSRGYKILRELEKYKLIGTKYYNSNQYVYPSYRAYYYFGINKKSIDMKPSERQLNKYFILAELYLLQYEKSKLSAENTSFDEEKKVRLAKIVREITFCNQNKSKIYTKLFENITNVKENQTYVLAEVVEELNKNKNFDSNGILNNILTNPYTIDEYSQSKRALYFSMFLQETTNYLKNRCFINPYLVPEKNTIKFFIKVIHEANRSYATYDNLINELNRLFYATKLFYKVKVKFEVLTFDSTDKNEVKLTLENTLRKREKSNLSKDNDNYHLKSNDFINHRTISITNLYVSRRIPIYNEYKSNRNKPKK